MKRKIIEKLKKICPELKNDIDNEISEYQNIYFHLIFGDIFNPYLIGLLDEPTKNKEKLILISDLIEDMASMDEYFQKTVATTVLERLSDIPEKYLAFRSFAGKNTVKLMNNQNNFL